MHPMMMIIGCTRNNASMTLLRMESALRFCPLRCLGALAARLTLVENKNGQERLDTYIIHPLSIEAKA